MSDTKIDADLFRGLQQILDIDEQEQKPIEHLIAAYGERATFSHNKWVTFTPGEHDDEN